MCDVKYYTDKFKINNIYSIRSKCKCVRTLNVDIPQRGYYMDLYKHIFNSDLFLSIEELRRGVINKTYMFKWFGNDDDYLFIKKNEPYKNCTNTFNNLMKFTIPNKEFLSYKYGFK